MTLDPELRPCDFQSQSAGYAYIFEKVDLARGSSSSDRCSLNTKKNRKVMSSSFVAQHKLYKAVMSNGDCDRYMRRIRFANVCSTAPLRRMNSTSVKCLHPIRPKQI